jgi:NAD-dependent DNA ligase
VKISGRKVVGDRENSGERSSKEFPKSPIVKINYEMDENTQKSSPKLLPQPKNTTQKTSKGEPKVKPPKKTVKDLSKGKTKSKMDIKSSLKESIVTSENMIPKYSEKAVIEYITRFKQHGIGELESLSQSYLAGMITVANANYYNDKGGLMTDNEYDIVKEYLVKKYPKNQALEQIGAPVEDRVRNKVNLPYEMWSMDKIKPDTNALSNWMKTYKGPYVISCKLDGVSGLYTTEGDTPKLYTRGDGKVGQDISFLLPSLKLPKSKGLVVRGEFIIPKKVFEENYAQTFANPRNLVSGIVNAKKADEKAMDLHFIAYEVIQPSLKPSEQMKKLKESGLEVVQYESRDSLSNDSLSDILVDWRTQHQYEIDGIIVTDDAIHPRISGNPDHAFAFKMILSDQKAEAKVVDVLWSPSKDGYLKPRLRIEPIRLGGVTIEYATGYNAKFIEDNKIGIGAAVEIIRSGDVIPKILAVTVPAEKAKMPVESYSWNETHVDILLENASENITVQEKNI